MIPTLLIVGLVFGRWWRVVIPLATLAWVAVLSAAEGWSLQLAAGGAGLAAANVTVGVLVHQALWLLARRIAVRPPREPEEVTLPGRS